MNTRARTRRLWTYLGFATISIVIAGCANATLAADGESRAVTGQEPGSGGPPANWDDVLVGGVEVSTVAQARSSLAFAIATPTGLGDPDKVVLGGSDDGAKATVVAMRYTTAAHGMFWLIQEESQTTQKELEALASTCDPSQGCEGEWSLVRLSNGGTALSIDGSETTSLMWLVGELRFELVGPSSTFRVASAEAVFETIPV